MLHLVENPTPESDIAYFTVLEDVHAPYEHIPEVRDFDAVRRAQALVHEQGTFPDVDLIVTALEQGIVQSIHRHLLREHLTALDPPIDAFFHALYTPLDQGRISEADMHLVSESLSVDWRENTTFDSSGQHSWIDNDGIASLAIHSGATVPGNLDEHVQRIATDHGLDHYIDQTELAWNDTGRPEIVRNPTNPSYPLHTTLGIGDTEARTFIPVMSVPDYYHPLRTG